MVSAFEGDLISGFARVCQIDSIKGLVGNEVYIHEPFDKYIEL